MPKNKSKGGKKFKKLKKGSGKEDYSFVYKMVDPFFRQQYAKVTKMLGNGRLNAIAEDGITRLCSISGKLKKRKTNGKIRMDDIILISVRPPNQTHLADVLHKYNQRDVDKFMNNEISMSASFYTIIKDEINDNEVDILFTNKMVKENGYDSDSSDENANDYANYTRLEKNKNRQIVYDSDSQDDK
tara:strand:- start:1285 stop:1842 length:558 start_codon:yes stop_codon:yes gene_type:complete